MALMTSDIEYITAIEFDWNMKLCNIDQKI